MNYALWSDVDSKTRAVVKGEYPRELMSSPSSWPQGRSQFPKLHLYPKIFAATLLIYTGLYSPMTDTWAPPSSSISSNDGLYITNISISQCQLSLQHLDSRTKH